ncbi:MAG TPA: helix-turn-helix transcriptional regulator [Ornithinibacter sp.]|nr:helix-turn-helix transcriptional regulator [Ornithinibacter sp.]
MEDGQGLPAGFDAEHLLDIARRHHAAGDLDAAWTAVSNLAAHARQAQDPTTLARAALVIRQPGDRVVGARVHALAREALTRVEALVARATQPDQVTALLADRLASQVAATRDPFGSDAFQVAAAQLDPAELRDPEATFLALQARVAEVPNLAHVEERLTLATRAVALGAATAMVEYEAWGRRWRMDAFAELGLRLELASERAAVAPLTEQLGAEWRSWLVLTRASERLLEGDFSTALLLADEARTVGGVGGVADFFHLVYGSEVAVWTGAGAQETAAALVGTIEHLPFLARSWLAIAWLAAGERDLALDVWRAVRGHVEKMPEDAPEWVVGAVSRVDLCEAFSDTVVAQLLYDELLPFEGRHAIGVAHAPHHGPVALALGRLALVLGRLDRARVHLTSGLAAAEQLQSPPYVGLAHAALAATYTPGTRARAEHTAAARALAERLASPYLADRVAALGGTARVLDARVTPRETEIAHLVAAGLTNGAIAQRLVLSERTVENHVSHLLHKLDLPTRGTLAVWVRDHSDETGHADETGNVERTSP